MEYIIGSVLLNLENNRDIDYLCLSDKEKEYRREVIDDKEILYISQKQLFNRLHFIEELNEYQLFNYQLDKKIIGPIFSIEYNLLDYREKLIELIDFVIKNNRFNFNKNVKVNKYYCCKQIYHIAYNIFILENNSTILTQEQKEIIQKLHDCEMPIEYIDKLKEKFYLIKNNFTVKEEKTLIEKWNDFKNARQTQE